MKYMNIGLTSLLVSSFFLSGCTTKDVSNTLDSVNSGLKTINTNLKNVNASLNQNNVEKEKVQTRVDENQVKVSKVQTKISDDDNNTIVFELPSIVKLKKRYSIDSNIQVNISEQFRYQDHKKIGVYHIKKYKDQSNKKHAVYNSYIFLIINNGSKTKKFYFEIIPPKNLKGKITILKPMKPFRVVPGVKKKKIVTLYTTDILTNKNQDISIPIIVRTYTLDDNSTTQNSGSVFTKSVFMSPSKFAYQNAYTY